MRAIGFAHSENFEGVLMKTVLKEELASAWYN
jgi:hypothetical protein